MELLIKIGAFAGLVAFFGLALLALLLFTQARDIRRLREWAGSSPERDAERKEATSTAAAQRAEELRRLEEAREAERQAAELRETRRQRREAGLPEMTRRERMGERFSRAGHSLREPRYLVATFLVALLVGGGVAYGVLYGFGGEDGGKHGKKGGVAKPGEIEVAVLNGTAEPGLAADYGDLAQRKGFELGEVTNSTSSFLESVVMFRPGSAPEAHRVAKALDISKVRAMTSDVAAVSAPARVSVIVGEDNASSTG